MACSKYIIKASEAARSAVFDKIAAILSMHSDTQNFELSKNKSNLIIVRAAAKVGASGALNRRLLLEKIQYQYFANSNVNVVKANVRYSSSGTLCIANMFYLVCKPYETSDGTNNENIQVEYINMQLNSKFSEIGEDNILFRPKFGMPFKIYGITKNGLASKPKADFGFFDNNGMNFFISHKKQNGGQQWSGMSEKKQPKIFSHPETQTFMHKIYEHIRKNSLKSCLEFERCQRFYSEIKDPLLQKMSIYGEDFGSEFGKNNCNVLIQGDLNLKFSYYKGKHYAEFDTEYQGLDFICWNGMLPTGIYAPILLATYRNNESSAKCYIRAQDFLINNARAGIYPSKYGQPKKTLSTAVRL